MNADEDEEFYDSETEPSICEEYINESLNESIISDAVTTYYAVQFKNDSINNGNSEDRIFKHQENAIKLLKKDPTNRRFKSFKTFQEAYAFSYEHESSENAPSLSQVKASIDLFRDRTNIKENSPRASNLDAEKLPYSAPKKPEVNQLRQFIEKNDVDSFKAKVLSNPRFLISAGDSPNLCQESFRYNCLHVCAKENRFEICDFLMKILSSTSYIQKLYKNDTLEQSKVRCNHLLDLYLNMPEKGLNETPLHFACKFGSLEVARILMSYEICQRTVHNKHGKSPQDLICTKATAQKSKDNENAINNLFEECFYVSLYRDDERGDVIVEKPTSQLNMIKPSTTNANDLLFNKYSPSISYEASRKLAAYVGPVSPKNANAIYERLKSPARLRQSPNNLDILRGDDFKGYERIVRQLTDEMKLPWTEFWAFLNGFSNLKSKEGLGKLEIYLEQKKIQSLLDSQKKSALNIRNEQNLNLFNPAKRNIELIARLEEFIKIVDELKVILELKENILSLKYEKLIQSIKENKSFSTDIVEIDDKNEINIQNLKAVLNRYMSTIISVCKSTRDSTQCYFDLYKTAKIVFELLHNEEIYANFTFSPVSYNKINNPCKMQMQTDHKKVTTMKKPMKRLTPKKKETFNPFQMRKPTFEYNSDDDDEQDEDKKKESDSSLSDSDEDNSEKMESNLAESEGDSLSLLISKIHNGMKIEEKIKNTDDDYYSLNNIENLKPVFNGFKKPADIRGLGNTNTVCNQNKQFKLFMYGDAPSKLDRAVYLAIMDINDEIENFTLLNEWYTYMKSCNKSEMSGWKTPMRKKINF